LRIIGAWLRPRFFGFRWLREEAEGGSDHAGDGSAAGYGYFVQAWLEDGLLAHGNERHHDHQEAYGGGVGDFVAAGDQGGYEAGDDGSEDGAGYGQQEDVGGEEAEDGGYQGVAGQDGGYGSEEFHCSEKSG
jgi:hypothetical protein